MKYGPWPDIHIYVYIDTCISQPEVLCSCDYVADRPFMNFNSHLRWISIKYHYSETRLGPSYFFALSSQITLMLINEHRSVFIGTDLCA